MVTLSKENYGFQDNSYIAAGELDGIRKLVDRFYELMNELPEAKVIRDMHPDDLAVSRDKLTHFLSGWLGGPRTYPQKYGRISIPEAHQHLVINEQERDAWLLCMTQAADQQAYSPSFKKYLLEQLSVPAERVQETSRNV
ncbi:MAG: group II truncated hemoglobin [Pseudomonadota bacterium]